MTYRAKPGPCGDTLYLYDITYTDGGPDSGCPDFHWRTWAYDDEHAIDRFLESDDEGPGGWRIIRADKVCNAT